jgi:hypothetical protein
MDTKFPLCCFTFKLRFTLDLWGLLACLVELFRWLVAGKLVFSEEPLEDGGERDETPLVLAGGRRQPPSGKGSGGLMRNEAAASTSA